MIGGDDVSNQIYDLNTSLSAIANLLDNKDPFEIILHFKSASHNPDKDFGFYFHKAFIWCEEHKILIIKQGEFTGCDLRFAKTVQCIVCENKNDAVLRAAEMFGKITDPYPKKGEPDV